MIIDGVEYNVEVTTEGTPSRLFIELKVRIPLPLGEYAEIYELCHSEKVRLF